MGGRGRRRQHGRWLKVARVSGKDPGMSTGIHGPGMVWADDRSPQCERAVDAVRPRERLSTVSRGSGSPEPQSAWSAYVMVGRA